MKIKTIILAATALLFTAANLQARSASVLSRNEIRTELQSYSIIRAELRDNRYVLPDSAWLRQSLIPFYVAYAEQNLAPALNDDAMSDGLCKVFQTIMYQANIRGGGTLKGDVPVGVMLTRAKGDHDLRHRVILRTAEGWSVIDPHNGAMMSLASFRNTNDILRVAI